MMLTPPKVQILRNLRDELHPAGYTPKYANALAELIRDGLAVTNSAFPSITAAGAAALVQWESDDAAAAAAPPAPPVPAVNNAARAAAKPKPTPAADIPGQLCLFPNPIEGAQRK